MEQVIRFIKEDGRSIAWARSGVGPPLVLAGWWMSHLELNWRDARFRSFVDALARHHTVVRYDAPGTGVVQDAGSPSVDVDAAARILGAVVDAAGEPVDLLAASSGAPVGIAYAAANPERVRTLVVYGGYASGPEITDARTREAMVRLVREHWGLGSRVLADVFMWSADTQERDAFVAYQREAGSAERAAAALEAAYRFDVAERLDQVRPGAVVLHRRGDRAIPFALGRQLAAGLPDATFVGLEGPDHYPWFGEADQVVRAVLQAIDGDAAIAPDRQAAADAGLTGRELEILTLIAGGLSDRQIAERLVLSPHTVHRHAANIRTKLGLPTRTAAVAAATRLGLLGPPPGSG